MLIIILIALAQSFALPGLILLLKVKGLGVIDRFLIAAPLSLVINYFINMSLILTGVYTTNAVRIIVLAEIFILLFALINKKSQSLIFEFPINIIMVFRVTLGLLVVIYSLYYVNWLGQFGTAITDWDGVVSWSKWGQDLFDGKAPSMSNWSYPQLIPMQYASVMKIAGSSELYILPKMVPVVIVGLLGLVVVRFSSLLPIRDYICLLFSFPVFIYFTKITVNGDYIFSGGGDITIAYFGVVAAYIYVLGVRLCQQQLTPRNESMFFLFAILVSSSLLVKQIGLVIVSSSILLYWIYSRKKLLFNKSIIILIIFSVLLPLHWYGYIYFLNKGELNTSTYTSLLANELWVRFFAAFNMLLSQFGTLNLFLIILGLLASARLLIIPVLINIALWIPLASYDTRGLYPILPLLAYFWVAGLLAPLSVILSFIQKKNVLDYPMVRRHVDQLVTFINKIIFYKKIYTFQLTSWYFVWIPIFIGWTFIFILQFSPKYEKHDLIDRSRVATMQYGGTPQMNRFLLDELLPNLEVSALLATDYQLAHYLPGLKPHVWDIHAIDLKHFSQAFAKTKVGYILVTNMAKPSVIKFLQLKTDSGELFLINSLNNYRLYKVANPSANCSIYLELAPDEPWGKCS